MGRIIFHIDVNSAFLSCYQKWNIRVGRRSRWSVRAVILNKARRMLAYEHKAAPQALVFNYPDGEAAKPSDSDDDGSLKAVDSIANGYELSLQKETEDAWYILCKKSRSNKVKDDPAKMELAVAKGTYLPIYIRIKKSLISISMENVTPGVDEASVTFNPDEFPGATIIDKR